MFSLVNIQDHPTNKHKKVFFYKNAAHAAYFEKLLIEANILYEKQIDTEGDQRIYFGVKKGDYKAAQQLNYLTIGNFRKPFISDIFFRYFIILLSVVLLTLAIAGAVISN